jgi:hypothetical protein
VKDDEDEMLTVVRNEEPPPVVPAAAATAANGVAHKPIDDGQQPIGRGESPPRDIVTTSASTNGIAPGAEAANGSVAPVQVLSAVSGKKMSLAEARAEFFNASRC